MNYRHNIPVKKYEMYKVMKAEGLLLPVNYTKELRDQMEARKEYLHKPEGINQLWQMEFHRVSDTGVWDILRNEHTGLLLTVCTGLSDP